MRLQDMDNYFVDRGFEVDRKYERIGDKSVYKFSIRKDGHSITRTFEYPNTDSVIREIKQREFLDDTIKAFEQLYLNTKVGVVVDDFIDDYRKSVIREEVIRSFVNSLEIVPLSEQRLKPKIKNVIFNDPATIVFWTDGTKTVVKCQDGDIFDPEKGLAMAISKKALGNKHDYCYEFLHWLKKYEKQNNDIQYELKCSNTLSEASKNLQQAIYKCFHSPKDAFEYKGKRDAVQKAYDILKDHLNGNEFADLEGALGFLGEALED